MADATMQSERDAAVHSWLANNGPATAREIAIALFGEVPGLTGRTRCYMIAYHHLRALEDAGAVKRERLLDPSVPRGHQADQWSHVPGAALPVRAQRGRPPSGKALRRQLSLDRWVVLHFTEAQQLALLGVLNDACADDPLDIELRALRATVRAAMPVHTLVGRKRYSDPPAAE